ncbi:uncharacterized protein BN535_02222 [Bacteroides caccae CAG:21]|jgi:hypothetical protein|nr:uncharacterized protein BN535_02222 [Bacteroides caccae CAG:21]
MGAIGLNPIRLDAIGLDPIRINAIKLGVPGASSATDRPYISPDVLSSLAGVWIADGKSNTDPDRNIIKNKLPGRGGDFEIFNAAYEGMLGYNGYPVVFGDNKTWEHLSGTANYTSDTTSTTIHITHVRLANRGLLYSYVKENGVLTNIKEIPAFRVTVKGLEGNSKFVYKYLATKDATRETSIFLSNGTHKLAKSFVPTDALLDSTTNVWIGMFISPISEEVTEFDCDITIEVLPEYEGAFVTDGVDDMIVSQNPVSEMLGGSKELTVVSMIHQISPVPDSYGFTNYIREGSIWSRTNVKTSGKTGIYGYKISKGNTEVGASNLIDNILGDKADYEAMGYNTTNYSDINYSVTGYIKDGSPTEVSSVAWYWTFIAKRALTTDEINQVIAYYNLDKYVKPDIYYNVKKQGLTNDNHAQFGDKLIDYSGNSRDLQLFNIGWNLGSGIGKYAEDFSTMKDYGTKGIVRTSSKIYLDKSFDYDKGFWLCYTNSPSPAYKVRVSGIPETGMLTYTGDVWVNLVNGINELPARTNTEENHGFVAQTPNVDWSKLVIEQIPDFAGALCLDGVNDFGQFVGDLGLKDYTVAADRAYQDENVNCVPFISSVGRTGGAPFLLEYVHPTLNVVYPYSYDGTTGTVLLNSSRQISYQSTYVYNRNSIARGNSVKTGDGLTIGSNEGVSQYSKLCLWSFLLFPYTLSEFLLERQMKKRKLGTLYPGMVEFRPIVKSNIPYSSISYSVNPGEYVIEGSTVTITITLSNSSDKLVDISSNAISDISISGDNGVYEVTGKITKSPQKINIVISSYLTMLDNETLITNETLIKNE